MIEILLTMILIFHIYPEGTDFNHVLKFVSPPVPYLSERDPVFDCTLF